MNVGYILYMANLYGHKTVDVLKKYDRTKEEIKTAFAKAADEGYLVLVGDSDTPRLTESGIDYLQNYYGNGLECYD